VCFSAEDGSFVAEVPELPGCMADGPTYQEALANAEQIIREWVETASALGRAIPTPRGWPKEDAPSPHGIRMFCVFAKNRFAVANRPLGN